MSERIVEELRHRDRPQAPLALRVSSVKADLRRSPSTSMPASVASSAVSTGDGRSHSITTTQDDKGCRVVIDERSARGEP